MIQKLTILKLTSIVAAAAALYASDPRIGVWKLVSADCALDPPRVLSITPHGKGVHVVISGSSHVDFTADWDGHDNHVKNIPEFNQIVMRRIDKNQTEIKEKKNGTLVATLRDKISSDRRELTITTIQQGHEDQITVWERCGGLQNAANPFIGEWAEDFSKTRLRQGLALKIEADGSGGIHFVGEFSYTANFDGQEYPLTGSRDDTVALALIDAHTVDSTYRRGDEIADRDRWVVSADGRQMTLTTTGVLITGEKIKEKLVFRKQ
ncbi:MAG: hypothetical protein WAK48_05505 [Candidatus Acidiferrum sp.]|jgi:hypothetical protein